MSRFDPRRQWKAADGRVLRPSEFTDLHLVNTIWFILRYRRAEIGKRKSKRAKLLRRWRVLPALLRELARRERFLWITTAAFTPKRRAA